jgi:hypothetical protein
MKNGDILIKQEKKLSLVNMIMHGVSVIEWLE